MNQQLEKAGISASRVVGCTPHLSGHGTNKRTEEIKEWVRANRPAQWVALDDYELHLDPLHYVRTTAGEGLTAANADAPPMPGIFPTKPP